MCDNVKYVHVRPHGYKGAMTVASVKFHESGGFLWLKDKVFVRYGVSYCSPKDQFNKRTGRQIAYNDLETSYNVIQITKHHTHKMIMFDILEDISRTHSCPESKRNLIKCALFHYLDD